MAELAPGQWELPGVVFGSGTGIRVSGWDTGTREFRTQDRPVPFGAGRVMGRDEVAAITYTWDLLCLAHDDPERARALERSLSSAWRGDGYRTVPGEVTQMRTRVWGGETARIYGRPRNYKAGRARTVLGHIPVTAEFAAVDDLLYGDVPVRVTVNRSPDARSGLGGAWQDPLGDNSGTVEQRSGIIDVPGDLPTQMIDVDFEGPVNDPGFEIVGVGTVTVLGSLASHETGQVRIHPAFRSVTLAGRPAAGQLTGTRLAAMELPTGPQEVRFHGLDDTGTSTMTVTVHPAYVSV